MPAGHSSTHLPSSKYFLLRQRMHEAPFSPQVHAAQFLASGHPQDLPWSSPSSALLLLQVNGGVHTRPFFAAPAGTLGARHSWAATQTPSCRYSWFLQREHSLLLRGAPHPDSEVRRARRATPRQVSSGRDHGRNRRAASRNNSGAWAHLTPGPPENEQAKQFFSVAVRQWHDPV